MTALQTRIVRDEQLVRALPPEFIVFDVNGTLLNTKRILGDLVRARRTRSGTISSPLDFSGDLERDLRRIARLSGRSFGEIVDEFVDRCSDDPPLYAGVREGLEVLAARMPLGIATNASRDLTNRLLVAARIDCFFELELIVAPAGKPSPAAPRDLLRRVGCRPGNSWMVGDSKSDITAATRAGMRVFGVMYGYGLFGNEPGVDAWLGSFYELAYLVQRSAA